MALKYVVHISAVILIIHEIHVVDIQTLYLITHLDSILFLGLASSFVPTTSTDECGTHIFVLLSNWQNIQT